MQRAAFIVNIMANKRLHHYGSPAAGEPRVRRDVRLEVCYSTQETHMFIKRKLLFPLQAVLWTGLVLPMSFPILGLLAPQPGAPLGGRSLGIGDYWLLRIVETPTPTGASWGMETNWLNLVLCAIIGGVAIAWIRSRHSDHAEQSGEREPPMTRVLKS
jgi:hypothetical protein